MKRLAITALGLLVLAGCGSSRSDTIARRIDHQARYCLHAKQNGLNEHAARQLGYKVPNCP